MDAVLHEAGVGKHGLGIPGDFEFLRRHIVPLVFGLDAFAAQELHKLFPPLRTPLVPVDVKKRDAVIEADDWSSTMVELEQLIRFPVFRQIDVMLSWRYHHHAGFAQHAQSAGKLLAIPFLEERLALRERQSDILHLLSSHRDGQRVRAAACCARELDVSGQILERIGHAAA